MAKTISKKIHIHVPFKDPCPNCGHAKRSHTYLSLDGVLKGKATCKTCGKKCTW